MSENLPDYSGEQVEIGEDVIKQLGQLAAKQGMLELEIEDLEKNLKEKKKELANYAESLVPSLMDKIGLKKVTTAGGLEVELRQVIRASLPKDEFKRKMAFAWLHDTGNDGIIKREITVRYDRESSQFADELMDKLEELGVQEHGTVEHEWTIHPATLASFLGKELEAGHNVPMEAFGAFVQRSAKIKRGG